MLFVSWQSDHFCSRYSRFHFWPCKFKVKVMAKVKSNGHIWGLRVQLICLLFVSWQSDHFWPRYSEFRIWPWKFKVKVMAKVKSDGHIWGLGSTVHLLSMERADWPKLHDMFKAWDAKARQREFPVGFPVRVCDWNLFLITIFLNIVARIESLCMIKAKHVLLVSGLGFSRPKPVFPVQNGINWDKPVFPSFSHPKLGKTVQNWEKLWRTIFQEGKSCLNGSKLNKVV